MDTLDSVRVAQGESELAFQKAKTTLRTQQAMNIFRVSDLPDASGDSLGCCYASGG